MGYHASSTKWQTLIITVHWPHQTVQHDLVSIVREEWAYENHWNNLLHGILFAYMINMHSNTNFSPFELFYGRKPTHPIYNDSMKSRDYDFIPFDDYVASFDRMCKGMMESAHPIIQRTQSAQKPTHDKKLKHDHTFAVRDMITYQKEKKCKGKENPKLNTWDPIWSWSSISKGASF